MNEYTENENGGGGCLTTLLVLVMLVFGLIALAGGDSTSTTTTTNTRSGALSGNQTELLSRNQLNILSEVWNCFGDNSCIITTEIVTNTATTNEVINVDGDRNTVTTGVLRTCVTADGWGYTTYEQCQPGYTEVQP